MLHTEEEISDGVAAARLVSLFEREPALRSAYLMASAQAEQDLVQILAGRIGRSPDDFDVRLCAAAAMAAVRVVDEFICSAAMNQGQRFEPDEVAGRLAAAIRSVSFLPVCDPVAG